MVNLARGGDNLAKLLIVDDDQFLLHGMQMLLSSFGHDVEVVSSGEEALAVIQADPPELVISDIQMASMTGLGLKIEPKLPRDCSGMS